MDDPLTLRLKALLAEVQKSQRVSAAERAHYKRVVRNHNISLAIGRLEIDASRAALEAQIAARRARD